MPRAAGKSFPSRERLEKLYVSYNRRCYVHPDPLEFLYGYQDPRDRELVALIASALAYGKVRQILKSVASVLRPMGTSPRLYLLSATRKRMEADFADFKHRFTASEDISSLLRSAANLIRTYSSLHECFLAGYRTRDETILPALSAFVQRLHGDMRCSWPCFLPSPARGSACKRLNLFLRWLVRSDEVDPGGWDEIPASKLIVPLDTHMHRISLMLGFTRRKQADLRTAVEITRAFRSLCPDDPARYDFVLTRFGIRHDMDRAGLPALCRHQEMAVFPRTDKLLG